MTPSQTDLTTPHTPADASVGETETAAQAAQRTAADAVPTRQHSRTHPGVQAVDAAFADYDIRPEIVEALALAGIARPFPIQAMTLPVALAGHDIIGQAKTGTGKTLGFGVPLLNYVVAPGEAEFDRLAAPGKPQALVVVPTRELAVQVAGDLATASVNRSVRIVQVYGGRAYEPQVAALQRGAEVVVGTPGRMLDLINQHFLDLSQAHEVVLDEADEMLDLGFLPDVEKILAQTPASRHTMLFSATMPGAVVAMARRYMTQPTHIRANDPEDSGALVKDTRQVAYRAHALDKVEVLARILQADGRGLTMVFARTKRTAAKVADDLAERGFAAAAIHGDLGQGAREQALRAFRNGKVDVLVATDVAARGIDVDDVTHVINYQCPEDAKTYLHRIGRTGRAGASGTAVTFVDWDDLPRWGLINRTLSIGIPEPAETYSTSPHLYTDLNIPQGTTGRLPRAARTRAGLAAEVLEDLGETGKRTTHQQAPDDRHGHTGAGHGGRSSGGHDGRSGGVHEARSGARRPARTARDPELAPHAASSTPVGTGAHNGEHDAPRSDGTPRRRRRSRRHPGGTAGVTPTGTDASSPSAAGEA